MENGSPLQIEGDLDGAKVRIRVVPNERNATAFVWVLVAVLGLVGGIAVWVGTALLVLCLAVMACCLVVLGYLGVRVSVPVQLELTIEPDAVLYRGVRVQVSADFQRVWVDGQQFTVDGGFSRKEYERLMALMERPERGRRSDVPATLQKISR